MEKKFFSNTKSLVNAIKEMGSPFSDDSSDLVTMKSTNFIPEKVVNTIKTTEEIDRVECQAFTEEQN